MLCFVVLLASTCVSAFPSVANKAHVHAFWSRRELTPRDAPTLLDGLRIALKHPRDALLRLQQLEERVSMPGHADYGRYLSKEELGDALMRSDDAQSEQIVRRWLVDSGIVHDDSVRVESVVTRDWLVVHNARVERVAAAFKVRFHAFEHRGSKRTIVRTLDRPVLPEHVADRVELVLGLGDFFDHPKERKASAVAARAAAASSAPQISVRSSHERLIVSLQINDLQGAPVTGFVPNARVHVNVTTTAGELVTGGADLSAKACALEPHLVCTVRFVLPSYSRVNVRATTFFAGAPTSTGSLPYTAQMAGWVDPATAFDLYSIPQGTFAVSGMSSQAVVAFEEQYINFQDIESFYEQNGLYFDASLFTVVGPNNYSVAAAGGESTLDLTWISAMGRNVSTYFLSFCGMAGPAKGPCGAYILDWALLVSNWTNSPLVTSISYGDTEQGYFAKFGSFVYIDRMEKELLKMALNGRTVIAGSGDAGATNVGEAGNDISATDPDCSVVRPFYPSASRYVVSLSASLLSTATTAFCASEGPNNNFQCSRVAEASVSITYGGTPWTTGGGFSGRIAQPSWQAAAIADYFKQTPPSELPSPANFNRAGRGYADLTAIGFNLMLVLGGAVMPIGGTSASGPVMAGIFALLNDIQFQKGSPPVGNPLPWIYLTLSQTSGAFNDLSYGRNDDGDVQSRGSPFPSTCPPPAGFPLKARWDSPSGWGSPVFPQWVQALPN